MPSSILLPRWAIAKAPTTILPQATLSEAVTILNVQQACFQQKTESSYLNRRLSLSRVLISAATVQDVHGRAYADCVVVANTQGQVLGLLTNRQLGQLGMDGVCFEETKAEDVIDPIALTFQQDNLGDLETAYDLFQHHGINYAPVMDRDNRLVGLLSDECLRLAMVSELYDSDGNAEQTSDFEQISQVVEALVQREQGLTKIFGQIYASLNLSTVLNTTVQEMRRLLQCDRVIIYKLQEDLTAMVVAESIIPGGRSMLHSVAHDPCVAPEWLEPYRLGKVRIVNDVYDAAMTVCHQELLIGLDIRSKLMVPIVVEEHLWGLMISSYKDSPRHWQTDEISLAKQLSQHAAIAIHQSQLYEESQSKTQEIERSYKQLQKVQLKLAQAEKMSGLGNLVSGIAHEINNPLSFIHGNLGPAKGYFEMLSKLVTLYRDHYSDPAGEISDFIENNDIDYAFQDFPNLIQSIQNGADRVRSIVKSLKVFSRLDESSIKFVDIHENIDSVLNIIQGRLGDDADPRSTHLLRQYETNLPAIECYASLLNQVFMNLIVNAIEAIEQRKKVAAEQFRGEIYIETKLVAENSVLITIGDNGIGMDYKTKSMVFDPFFTTKSVGSGTGMGLATSYQIVVENHEGELSCDSIPGKGTIFNISLPIKTRSVSLKSAQ
ncbi:MAG: ATP-binding protein [Cyanobacteria bacterium P01_C01_bin.89]